MVVGTFLKKLMVQLGPPLPGYGGPTAILAANAAPELFSALAARR